MSTQKVYTLNMLDNKDVYTFGKDDILDSSIQSNEKDENYEICEVFRDIRKILNEA